MKGSPERERAAPHSPGSQRGAQSIQPSSPRFFLSSVAAANPAAGSHRRIAIAVDLSDESAFAVKWAVQNYLRPGDAVILLHVRPTSVLYGADWGCIDSSVAAAEDGSKESQQKLEDDFDAFTTTKAHAIHIVKDHDMKERLCLEVERLGLSAVIMGSRASARRGGPARAAWAASATTVFITACVLLWWSATRRQDRGGAAGSASDGSSGKTVEKNILAELQPVLEEPEDNDASDEHKGN
ncbi:unnamed protein product [Spirodela intermedia]|uniref:UspA domain-containing protein n=1 Tax=Spirodela intermedia TaxID=51605 RepID=A0A7I8JPC0_SPIIN|nr:unnamed protein product [Spirodela intermedia]CAA6672014.1 unnamed protein product [Spirodela intermedia]